MTGKFYVYELADPRCGSVFYVGKGQRNRINAHEIEARNGRQSRKCERIREIERFGLHVVKRKVSFFADEQEAYDAEAELVQSYGVETLTNMMPGGGCPRNGPTLYADRLQVSATAEMLNRTKGGRINAVLVAGKRLDLTSIIETSISRSSEIIERRGVDWANAIAKRFGVEFTHGCA